MLDVGTVIGWMEQWYPPQQAADWDRVGLIVGGRNKPVSKILLAVDPVGAVGQEAVDAGAQMIITHHPLYLRGTSFISEDDAKGALVTELIRANVALYNAHTNADVQPLGVADALARLVGLDATVPMEITAGLDVGYGRIGTLPSPMTLGEFAKHVAKVLPAGPNGILIGGDSKRLVRTVAVSGGSGDSFLELAGDLGADVFLTADLRHHPASEHLEDVGPALICGSHWATEWPWLPVLAQRLREKALQTDNALEVVVSDRVTEPWFAHLPTAPTQVEGTAS